MLGIGIDAAEADRLAGLLGSHPDRFLDRCFRDGDIAREAGADGMVDPERVAVAWAAKEAALKALGGELRRLPYRDVECVRGADGGLELKLHGAVAARAAARGVERCRLDVTRNAGTAVAVVLLESVR